MTQHFDVLVIGAGLSGIGAAYHLQKNCPGKSFAILESRAASGGTWDLFRYPGVRSDSDMYTLGYAFRPWREAKAIADGGSILAYIRETAAAYGIDRKIRYGHKVVSASWSSADARWTVEVEHAGQTRVYSCGFLFTCTGYYDYAAGHAPVFPGAERFQGVLVHPQHWPQDLDYSGKRVVIIGSGATAITLAPAMADTAAHVTLLQRSPTYIVSRPARDRFADTLRRRLPAKLAYDIIRWRNVLMGAYFYNLARRQPAKVKAYILSLVRKQLGPDYDVATHFTPRYNPWDQRLCLTPDADLFAAIRSGQVSVATDQIETFTETGIRLKSGAELAADVVVSATGLKLLALGGMRLSVDGVAVDLGQTLAYRGTMYSGVPNLASTFGYTNASWTLKCDLTSEYVCRLINHMDRKGYAYCTPILGDPDMPRQPLLDFSSGYVQRAVDYLPKQGSARPWRMGQSYVHDYLAARLDRLEDGVLRFSKA
jgi:cation diffusion facilitator CzcD-associated flavoprotein CzcO